MVVPDLLLFGFAKGLPATGGDDRADRTELEDPCGTKSSGSIPPNTGCEGPLGVLCAPTPDKSPEERRGTGVWDPPTFGDGDGVIFDGETLSGNGKSESTFLRRVNLKMEDLCDACLLLGPRLSTD